MDVNDLKNLHKRLKFTNEILGNEYYKKPIPAESISRLNARRSLVLNRSISKGCKLSIDDLICKRPGTGISPTLIDKVIGSKLSRDLDEDHILEWQDLLIDEKKYKA